MAELPRPLDPRWLTLRSATPARIGLARAGSAVTTSELLAFQRAHAEARDAVHDRLDVAPLLVGLAAQGLASVALASAAGERHTYLLRPDLGRRLDDTSRESLSTLPRGHDLVFVLADGLSARALMRHALPLLGAVLPLFRSHAWRVGPTAVVEQGRVAIGDEIGAVLDAVLVAMLIGERPGLSAPDSLGVYLTWAPKPGRSDAERNCLSNIRPDGMAYAEAAQRLFHLATEARRRQITGVALKDETMPTLPSGDGD
jgi:ethanolamine ammonia-lyase small subunit